MIFLTTQPDTDYYIWQLQVHINNFKKFGCEDKSLIIFGYNPIIGINKKAKDFEKKTIAKILYYPDTRDLSTRLYTPSIRPFLLKQLYKNDPEILNDKNFLYLDCDILLSNYPNFNKLDDEYIIHTSDSSPMYSINDLIKNNYDLFKKMCEIVKIDSNIIIKNSLNDGGVTYFFKKINYFDYHFWDKVEKDSVNLYKILLVTVSATNYVQLMIANKWSLLWNLWLAGYDTKISDELSLSYPNTPINEWKNYNLYNNAGVSIDDKNVLFYKGDYIGNNPFKADLNYVSNKYCSFKYIEEIVSTGKIINYE